MLKNVAEDRAVVHARVDTRLLSKVARLFTGTVQGRMVELLQNARRAGAQRVQISAAEGWISVHDDGQGIEDFTRLLNLGGSDWAAGVQGSEDPAGVGLFCLTPRETIIASGSRRVHLRSEHSTGTPVPIETAPEPITGTLIRFKADEAECEIWACSRELLPYAVFSGMTVATSDAEITPQPFLTGKDTFKHPELGLAVEILPNLNDLPLHGQVRNSLADPTYGANLLLNFHGQLVPGQFRGVRLGHADLTYLVHMTGEATDLRLMLPARTRLVQDAAFERLQGLLAEDSFRYLQQRGRHQLPYREWQRAKRDYGIELPEAEPVFKVGLLYDDGTPPEPPVITLPDGFSIAQGCRGTDALPDDQARNAHLLACVADPQRLPRPFVPLDIAAAYAGYGWYNRLPTIVEVQLDRSEHEIHRDALGDGELICVERLSIVVRTSDDVEFRADVPIACAMGELDEPIVYVTPEAREVVGSDAAWHLLGGYSEMGDSVDTQERDFEDAWDRFWMHVAGPDEAARTEILAAVAKHFGCSWNSLTASADGTVRIEWPNGDRRELRLPS